MAASGHPCGALRPGQITPGRQVGRPLSPARVRAMPERFVGIERPQKTVYQEEGRPAPCPKQAAGAAGRPQRRFQGQGKGQGRASGSRRPSALNLSCFQEKQSVSNGKAVFVRRTTPPRPSPARGASRPLSSGVQAAGRFASFDCPPDWRLGPFQWHQGCGFAHVLTRSVLAVPAALRVRPPGVPLTPLPLENRGSAGQIARFALAAGRRTGRNNLAP